MTCGITFNETLQSLRKMQSERLKQEKLTLHGYLQCSRVRRAAL